MNVNAENARKLAESKKQNRVEKILSLIEQEATKGNFFLKLSFPLSEIEQKDLLSRRFKIEALPSMAQQKDGDFVKISW